MYVVRPKKGKICAYHDSRRTLHLFKVVLPPKLTLGVSKSNLGVDEQVQISLLVECKIVVGLLIKKKNCFVRQIIIHDLILG